MQFSIIPRPPPFLGFTSPLGIQLVYSKLLQTSLICRKLKTNNYLDWGKKNKTKNNFQKEILASAKKVSCLKEQWSPMFDIDTQQKFYCVVEGVYLDR